ncbi:type VI secretion system Vgr family protein [Roseateles sp. BYS180W]|uniref:Type VI secretion system Vgr family protein n=1 Tax=Roseateles rivi TaxID=3299028 RepID=A0ABW7FS05_9BURK
MTAALDILHAAFTGGMEQGTRLLRVHTPLGPDTLLAELLELHEAVVPAPDLRPQAGFHATLYALSTNAHFSLKSLLGQAVLVELGLADGSRRVWHAHVAEAALVGADGGLARYRLALRPWLALLALQQQSRVFLDLSVPQILDEVFAAYAGQGRLVPQWRWALQDAAVYPARSLCIQYQESDLDFVLRLMREEGLVCWWEHQGQPLDGQFGQHTLVIGDHNGAFTQDLGPVRYTQAGAGLTQDSLTRWRRRAAVAPARVDLASADYRARSLRPVSQATQQAALPELAVVDVPGQYAYPDPAQGQRLALRQVQALEAWAEQVQAQGTLRQAAAGAVLTLTEHPVHDGRNAQRDRFVILAAQHRARSNFSADTQALLQRLGPLPAEDASTGLAADTQYQVQLQLQRHTLAVRPQQLDARGVLDVRMRLRPRIHGVQTAHVVGTGGPVHSDRDQRVRLRFVWQRDDAATPWVRVAQSLAGANWGSAFTPRVGQEVLVGFVGADIDRPVVLGALYNGRGQADAAGNTVCGAAGLGSAPAWFTGNGHAAALSGIKTQELTTSAQGQGGANQLVLDDSEDANRIELSSSTLDTRLQLGQLRQQQDNQRLRERGHGLELSTQGWGALRAASGLLLTAQLGAARSAQMQAQDAAQQLQQAQNLLITLARSAQQHKAGLPGEPAPEKLGAAQALQASADSISSSNQGGGSVAAWTRPELVLSAAQGVGQHCVRNQIWSAGAQMVLTAQQDVNLLAQGNLSVAARAGLVLYSYGKATNADKPNQETGLKLHAASGSVNVQAQSGALKVAADKALDVASTQALVRVAAPERLLLAAAGAAIEIKGGNITLKAPGQVNFKAGMKELTSGGGARAERLSLKKAGKVYDEQFVLRDKQSGEPLCNYKYRIEDAGGTVLARGFTDAQGRTQRVYTSSAVAISLFRDDE